MNNISYRERLFKTTRIAVCLMIILALGGFVCQWAYKKSSERSVVINEVRSAVLAMEAKADSKMAAMKRLLINNHIDSLEWITFEEHPFTCLVFNKEQLVFWSDNQTEPVNITNQGWEYKELSNIHALVKSDRTGDYNIVVHIPLKYNYPYENKELQNEFVPALKLHKNIDIVVGNSADKYAVFSADKSYLFTLQLPEQAVYNENLAVAALVLFLLAYCILFYVFSRFPLLIKRTSLSWSGFFGASSLMTIFVFCSLRYNLPVTFFQNKIFTPYQYASSAILSTLTHLSFLTLYIYALIYLFCFYVKKRLRSDKFLIYKKILLLLTSGACYMLIFSFLIGVVFNSSTEINISRFKDITFVSVWNHLLFLFWGISFMLLFVKIHLLLLRKEKLIDLLKKDAVVTIVVCIACYFLFGSYGKIAAGVYVLFVSTLYLLHFVRLEEKKNWFLTCWLFVFTLFVTWTSISMNRDKKFEKYRMIAENHYVNENMEENRIAVSLLEDLNYEMLNNKLIQHLVQFPDSIPLANEYINNTYLRGFWSRYEMRLFGASRGSEWDMAYKSEIENWGRRIKNTNFYFMRNPKSDMAFLGAFKSVQNSREDVNFYMEFYPKRSYKSYSFPNLLIESAQGIQIQLSLSSARYAYRELVSFSGKYNYRTDAGWIEKNKERYFVQRYNGYNHYIFVPDIYNYYILSEEVDGGFLIYFLYFLYAYVLYLCISIFATWLYKMINRQGQLTYDFSTKFQVSFISLMLLSFISIFYLSVNDMQRKYEQEQKQTLEATKNYIQMALQEKYYWQEQLDSTMSATLNYDLQDLSYIYHTDIHVYDNEGELIGSSQPALFSRELISRRMSPVAYFSRTENSNQYEKIGNLKYLTAYTDFYNGDFLQIGYIAVPQFLSGDLIQADLESFLTGIVHIYLIFIILSVALSLLITKQLSSPLVMLQESLKQIRIGQANKKISYKPKDEISQLVEQYNRMVDELEKSALLLAKSERESAWKTMARQIAHEINNPLTPMKLTIQHLQHRKAMNDERFDEYFDKSSTTLIEQIENLSKIAITFSSFAKLPEPKFEKVDVAEKLKSVLVLFSNNADNVELNYHGADSGIFAVVDREQLLLVFNNLIKNALQAIPSNRAGRVDVIIGKTDKWIVIRVIDNGDGIREEIKDKLFTPNFTTKSTGMGLGLSISRNIVQMFGGKITFDARLDAGAEFKVVLPCVD